MHWQQRQQQQEPTVPPRGQRLIAERPCAAAVAVRGGKRNGAFWISSLLLFLELGSTTRVHGFTSFVPPSARGSRGISTFSSSPSSSLFLPPLGQTKMTTTTRKAAMGDDNNNNDEKSTIATATTTSSSNNNNNDFSNNPELMKALLPQQLVPDASSGAAALTMASSTSSTTMRELPPDNYLTHIAVMAGGTLWWYVFATIKMVQDPSGWDYLNLNDFWRTFMTYYTSLSQVAVISILSFLPRATSLRQGQLTVALAVSVCVPADALVVLFDPTGSKATTVLAFAMVTMFFGVYMAHYLKKAAFRERDPLDKSFDNSYSNVLEGLIQYRPPPNVQATNMAVTFTRAFVAFTVTLAAVKEILGQTGGLSSVEPAVLAGLVIVLFHSALESILATLFPGADLQRYRGFAYFETILYTVHMYASTVISQGDFFNGTSWLDELTSSWLFGNATAKLVEAVKRLTDFTKPMEDATIPIDDILESIMKR